MRWQKKLKYWQAQQLLTEEQVQAIAAYEQKRNQQPWVQLGFIFLGISSVILGFISIVTANWYRLNPYQKLSGQFILCVLTGLLTFISARRARFVLFESTLALYLLFCFSAIALLGQIYHLGGTWYQAVLFWNVISLPAVLFSRYQFLPTLWVYAFWAAALRAIFSISTDTTAMAVFYDLVLLSALLYIILQRFTQLLALKQAARNSFFALFLVALVILDASIAYRSAWPYGHDAHYLLGVVPLMILLDVLIWLHPSLNRRQKILLFVISALYVYAVLPAQLGYYFAAGVASYIYAACLTLMILLLCAFFFASRHCNRLFNSVLCLMGLRLVLVYFHIIGNLMQTGIGLISTGMVIILFTVAVMKLKAPLQRFSGRLLT